MIRPLAWLLVPVLLLGSLRAGAQEPDGDPLVPRAPVTVFLLRHAETLPGHDAQRSLSEAGRARADALARLLSHAGVTHLYSSSYPRTRETLAPLAQRTGCELLEIPARDGARQVAELGDLPPGSVAVVAGHSNTVPALVLGLGGEVRDLVDSQYGPTLGEDEYDRLWVVTLPGHPAAAVGTLELRYGR